MAENSKEIQADSTNEKTLTIIYYGIPQCSDVVLIVEGHEFHVHKMILGGRSPYFHALFYGGFKEKDKDRIEIKDVAAVPFRRLLDFIYHGKISDEDSFTGFPYVTNIGQFGDQYRQAQTNAGFGELKTEHNAVGDKKEHIKNFWKASSEVLQLADRFDIKMDFKEYFTRLLGFCTCTTADCFVCVTMYIFGLANGLNIDLLKFKKHNIKFMKQWLQTAEEAQINEDDCCFNAVVTLLKSLG